MNRTTPEMALACEVTRVRGATLALAAPLSAEDCGLQSMPDASPVKWHLAHTTWFFETFVLAAARPEIAPFDPSFGFLFNSYYEAVGPRHARMARGLISRPSLDDVRAYRAHVDARLAALLAEPIEAEIARRVVLGLHHEQQHQELILTDVLHALAQNPTNPVYGETAPTFESVTGPRRFVEGASGVVSVGHEGVGFSFDNELPRHRVFLERHALADHQCTNADMLAFIAAGGYQTPAFWLSAGFDFVQREGLHAPLYWDQRDGVWHRFSLRGLAPVDPAEPVCHLSYYEADALARFLEARLPTEAEWEAFARAHAETIGAVWEWTSSAYSPYPGYAVEAGALGEYNGKFMVGQQVLRGASCFTPKDHSRVTYRNFFPPHARWQMTGLRLARSIA